MASAWLFDLPSGKNYQTEKCMISIIKRWLYPTFECEVCHGIIEYSHKCQCIYWGAVAPGIGPNKFITFLRKWIKNEDI